jgi:diguanylate cyclase (GGDEF)-like protein
LTVRARPYDVAATDTACQPIGGRPVPKPPSSSFQDPLTGLSNRQHFEVLYDFAFPVADRGIPLTLVFVELDGLAAVRAREGEAAERAALSAFGRLLLRITRSMDVAAHLEAGRFVVMLFDCNLHGGLVCADRVRAEAAEFTEQSGLTMSAGVACHDKDMKRKEDLLAVAEETLRVAVSQGGDRVAVPADLRPVR